MILQRLKHDKVLNKKSFPNFVESWNFTIDRMMNLKGDKDVNPDIGAIEVDNTDPLHPVIRFNAISSDINDLDTPPDSNDSENGLSSVEWIWPETSSDIEEPTEGLDKRPKAFSLFNFGKEENDGTLSVNINQLSGTVTPESDLSGRYDFLVRHDGVLKYMDLQLSTALPISGGGGGGSSDFDGFDYVSTVEWGALPTSHLRLDGAYGGYGFTIYRKHFRVENGQVITSDITPQYIDAVAHSAEMDV